MLQLRISYVQKEEEGSHTLQTRDINKSRGIYVLELETFWFPSASRNDLPRVGKKTEN